MRAARIAAFAAAASGGAALAQTATMAIAESAGPRGAQGCDSGEVRIRFSHVVVEQGHPKGEAAAKLAAAINAELDGRACMIVYPDSTLYDDNAVLGALLEGKVEMAAPSLSKFEPYTLVYRIFDLPFLFRDADAVEWFQNSGPGSRLKRALTPTGLHALTFWNNGLKQISANRPLLRPEDARGLTFRIQNSEVIGAQFQVLGAEVREMPFKDVADALASGRVDGQENSWSNILSKEFYRWQDGVTESNHGLLAYLVVTSEAFWGELPADLRAQLTRIIVRVSAEANREARRLDDVARAEIEARGVTIRRLSAEERAAWIDAMEPVWRRFEAQIGQDFILAAESANR